MTAWKFKTAVVTVGENSQKVRALKYGERIAFQAIARDIKAGKKESTALQEHVAVSGCIEPQATAADVTEMPSDLVDAIVTKVVELSGMRTGAKDTDEAEKKDEAAPPESD